CADDAAARLREAAARQPAPFGRHGQGSGADAALRLPLDRALTWPWCERARRLVVGRPAHRARHRRGCAQGGTRELARRRLLRCLLRDEACAVKQRAATAVAVPLAPPSRLTWWPRVAAPLRTGHAFRASRLRFPGTPARSRRC